MTAAAGRAGRDGAPFVAAVPYAVPMRARFRGITVREGVLLHGPAGWGEFCPFPDYADADCVPWLSAALEQCTGAWPRPRRQRVPVNCIVPAVGPERAADMVVRSGCRTAKVKVADHPGSAAEDLSRVAAVREALGPTGHVRVDANGEWDVDTAVAAIRRLDRAARGLQYVEQPCRTIPELAAVRCRVDVPIAADESVRRIADPLRVVAAGAADILVVKAAPLGGVHRALAVAVRAGLSCVVSSAVETSVGLAAGVALAAALPSLDYACGLGTALLLDADVVDENAALRPVDGELPAGRPRPVPHPDRLHRYAQRDPARAAWWLSRLSRVRDLLDERDGAARGDAAPG